MEDPSHQAIAFPLTSWTAGWRGPWRRTLPGGQAADRLTGYGPREVGAMQDPHHAAYLSPPLHLGQLVGAVGGGAHGAHEGGAHAGLLQLVHAWGKESWGSGEGSF